MSKSQKSWRDSTEHGFRDLSRARPKEAARRWLEADTALPSEASPFDPLRAAAQSNAGVARLLLGHDHEAAACFEAAEQSWRNAIAGIATLDVPMTGASSSFHFRLAAAAPETLIQARRDRYRRLCEAALAITQFNRGFVEHRKFSATEISERAFELQPMLSEVFGTQSPEVRLLSACMETPAISDVFAIYTDKLSAVSSHPQTFAAVLSNECAGIESAVALTALLSLPVFMSARRTGHAEMNDSNVTFSSLNDV